MGHTRKKGSFYEGKALQYLEQQGYQKVVANYVSPWGEIDFIMRDVRTQPSTLVFVEVKYRSTARFGDGMMSVGYAKQQKIIRTAQAYLTYSGYEGPCRFDVVALSATALEHLENAFESMF